MYFWNYVSAAWVFQTYNKWKLTQEIIHIINEIFMLRSVPYDIRNPRDLDSQLPKLVYCGLETVAYKVPKITTCENKKKVAL